VNNRFSRWRIVIPAATIKLRLPGRYVVVNGDAATVLDGNIVDVQVVSRMTGSGRIAVARVFLTTGAVDVRGGTTCGSSWGALQYRRHSTAEARQRRTSR
jgi:hypothetical protein